MLQEKRNPNRPSRGLLNQLVKDIDDLIAGEQQCTYMEGVAPAFAVKVLRERGFRQSFEIDFDHAQHVIYVHLTSRDYGKVGMFTEVKGGLMSGFTLYTE